MISYFLNQSAQTIFNLQITKMCSLLIHNLIHKNFVLQLEVTGSRVARGQKWQVPGPEDIPLSRVTMVENIQINFFNQNIQSMNQFFRTEQPKGCRRDKESPAGDLCCVGLCQLKSVIRFSHVMNWAAWKKATNGRKHGLVITPVAGRFKIIDNFQPVCNCELWPTTYYPRHLLGDKTRWGPGQYAMRHTRPWQYPQ